MANSTRKSYHRLYGTWNAMRQRCYNPKVNNYHLYGGRGIEVCERWESFWNFAADMEPTHREGLTLDRIDNDGNYEPGNCRWATPAEQGQHTRWNRLIEIDGITKPMSAWIRESGLKTSVVKSRFYCLKWDARRALGL